MSTQHQNSARSEWSAALAPAERRWIAVALVWALVVLGLMLYWQLYGRQGLGAESGKITPAAYLAKAQAFAAKYAVRSETAHDVPLVHPPAGSDVYIVARQWSWWPVLELDRGKTYRLHLSSMDYDHGFSLQETNINVQVIPGYERVVKLRLNEAGSYTIVCDEYCGIGHSAMLGHIYVK